MHFLVVTRVVNGERTEEKKKKKKKRRERESSLVFRKVKIKSRKISVCKNQGNMWGHVGDK